MEKHVENEETGIYVGIGIGICVLCCLIIYCVFKFVTARRAKGIRKTSLINNQDDDF